MLLAILAIVMTLLVVIGIHELGHAFTAWWFKIRIKRISIGFGRPLVLWKNAHGIEWSWSMWPFGGYVELLNSRIHPVSTDEFDVCFDKKSFGVKILVLLSGVIANLLVAWLAFVFVFFIGLNQHTALIKHVIPGSIAFKGGLQPGDQILSIEQRPVHSWGDVGMALLVNWGQPNIRFSVLDSKSHSSKNGTLGLAMLNLGHQGLLESIGLVPDRQSPLTKYRAADFKSAVVEASEALGYWLKYYISILKHLITGSLSFSLLLGPLGFLAATLESFRQGLVLFSYFLGSFSIAVAVVNILPIPGLDGGSLVYAVIEKIRGKPVSIALEVLIHRLVFIAFCIVLVHLFMNDLSRILG